MINNSSCGAQVAQQVVATLADAQAIFINTNEFFTYSSGIKSPIYCDNRVLISHPKARNFIAKQLAAAIREHAPECELIAATATGAIAHGAWVAHELDLPMVYILSKPKTHGRGKLIEGHFEKGTKAVIIEDLISSGGSALAALKNARAQGLLVDKIFSIFSYDLPAAHSAFSEHEANLFALASFEAFASRLSSQELDILNKWRNSQ